MSIGGQKSGTFGNILNIKRQKSRCGELPSLPPGGQQCVSGTDFDLLINLPRHLLMGLLM